MKDLAWTLWAQTGAAGVATYLAHVNGSPPWGYVVCMAGLSVIATVYAAGRRGGGK